MPSVKSAANTAYKLDLIDFTGTTLLFPNTTSITGTTTLTNTTTISSTTTLSGNTTLSGYITFPNFGYLSNTTNTLTITGNTIISNTLTVSGNAYFSNNLTVNSNGITFSDTSQMVKAPIVPFLLAGM